VSSMTQLLNSLLVLVLLLNLFALGTSRIRAIIRTVALQGLALSSMVLVVDGHLGARALALALGAAAIKVFLIPTMLYRALDQGGMRREVEPVIGLLPSMALGGIGTGVAIVLSSHLPLLAAHRESLIVPCALSTLFSGFLLMITRIKAVTQVLGYVVLENGIFVFGLLLVEALPLVVEVGVLLDLFVAIFVINIILHHIGREFSSLDTKHLSSLRE